MSVCALHSFFMSSTMCAWAFYVASLFCVPSPVSLCRLPLLFYTLLVLSPALHLQCRHRRGLKPLRTRTMRSVAPWRYTILFHRHSVPGRCKDVTQSFFTIHSQLIVSRKQLWWNLKKSFTRKKMCHLDHHQRFPTNIIGWMNWIQKSLEAAKTPNESNQNPKTQSSRTVRPVCGLESTQCCVLMPTNIEEDYTGTGRPVMVDQKEEHEIDFRVPGLTHAVVKEAEHLQVHELIENHPHRGALQADLQENDV